MSMLRRPTRLVSAGLVATMTFVGIGASPAFADDNSPTPEAVQASSSEQGSPAGLPTRTIDDVRAEAQQEGLDADQTEMAVELQRIVNAYHELPEELQGKPISDPEVREEISKTQGSERIQARAISFFAAVDCIYAIADAASTVVPGANVWKMVKVAGGVVTVAQVIVDYYKGKLVNSLADELGEEAGRVFKELLAYQAVIDSCNASALEG